MSSFKTFIILTAIISFSASSLLCGQQCDSCNQFGECTACKSHHMYLQKGVCFQCPTECKTCQSYQVCTSCGQGKEMLRGQCVSNYIDRMATIIGVVIGATIALICVIKGIKNCLKRISRNQEAQGQVQLAPSRESLQDLDKYTNEVVYWEDVQKQIKLEQVCVICQDSPGNVQISCSHKYHIECIRIWINKLSTCPLCRNLVGKEATVICTGCKKSVWKTSLRSDALLKEPSKCPKCMEK